MYFSFLGWSTTKLSIFKPREHLTNRQLWMICTTLNHKIQHGVPRIWILRQMERTSSYDVSHTKEKKNNGKWIITSSQGVFSNIGRQLLVHEFNPNPRVWPCFSLQTITYFMVEGILLKQKMSQLLNFHFP